MSVHVDENSAHVENFHGKCAISSASDLMPVFFFFFFTSGKFKFMKAKTLVSF